MEKYVNHKRFIHVLEMYRIRRILKAGGYFKFKDTWEEFIIATLAGVVNYLSEEHCLELIEIKNKALLNYKDHVFGFFMDPEGYDNVQYNLKYNALLEEHYSLLHDIYVEHDIAGMYDAKERFIDLNDARLILSKKAFEKRVPSLRAYVAYEGLDAADQQVQSISDLCTINSHFSHSAEHSNFMNNRLLARNYLREKYKP